jgi:hypothetical protein
MRHQTAPSGLLPRRSRRMRGEVPARPTRAASTAVRTGSPVRTQCDGGPPSARIRSSSAGLPFRRSTQPATTAAAPRPAHMSATLCRGVLARWEASPMTLTHIRDRLLAVAVPGLHASSGCAWTPPHSPVQGSAEAAATFTKKRGSALLVASKADLVTWIVMTGLANIGMPPDEAFPRLAHGLTSVPLRAPEPRRLVGYWPTHRRTGIH